MPQGPIRFEEFELDVESCELRRSGRPLRLERLPMQLLILLVQNPGKLVRRQAIERSLWGEGTFVEAGHSINTAINKLRATLRDDSRNPRYIRTVIGQGYKFIAKLRTEDALVIEKGTAAAPTLSSPNAVERELLAVRPEIVAAYQPTPHRPAHEFKKFSGAWFIAGGLASLAILLLAQRLRNYA